MVLLLCVTNVTALVITTAGSHLGPLSARVGLPTITTVASGPPPLVASGASSVSSDTTSSGSGTVVKTSTIAGVSAGLLNLLPITSSKVLPPTTGVYVGEGMPPVPPKLAAKIRRWEFVDMAEMLPEYWSSTKSEDEDQKRVPPRRTRQVTDIFTWIQCFASYTSVLAGHYVECVPEMMAYLVIITRVSQDFSGLAWVRYDASFRHQAAITGNRKWLQINPPCTRYASRRDGKTMRAVFECRAQYEAVYFDVGSRPRTTRQT